MKLSVTLTETEMKEALMEYVKSRKNFEAKQVSITHYAADPRDPRESSSFSAIVSE